MLVLLAAALLAALLCAATTAARADNQAPLYRFRGTSEEVTRVRVGAPARTARRISPRIFSNFLEHLGGAIYEGLWANCVYNPIFHLERGGGPIRWTLAGGAAPVEGGPSGTGVTLPDGGEARQLLFVPAFRELRYRGSVWAHATSGAPTVEVQLRRLDKPAVLSSKRVAIKGGAWAPARLDLTLHPDSLQRGEAAELVLRVTGGTCLLTNVELFPADAVDGMNPEVVAASKALRMELLRWPGGNFASGYHWQQAIGPREKRPTVPNPAWGGLETHHFGTDEFMRFCRLIGAKPQICVNAGNGTPEEAAAWVEYCNGGPETPMGRLRTANGRRAPYNVRVWEIGNELYGGWQIGHTDPSGNAERFVRFRQAMRKADPTIEIIATGKGDQYVGGGLAFDTTWNSAVLDAAHADPAGAPPYLSVHPLVPLPEDLARRFGYDEVYASTMAHPQWWAETFAPDLAHTIEEHAGRDARTLIAPTEWGIIVGGPQWIRYPNHNVMSGAVYAGLWLNAMLRTADHVGLSNVTALLHGGGIARPAGVTIVFPMYHVQRMYDEARPARLLPTEAAGPAYDVPQRGFLPAARSVPYLDVQAAERGGVRYLFVVNRDQRQARAAEIALPFAPASAEIETVAGEPQQSNDLQHPNAVRPVRAPLQVSGTALSHTFPPCSVSVITLR